MLQRQMHARWKTRGVHLLDDASPLWSVLYLSALRRRQHHPSLSLLILFSRSPPDRQLVFWFTAFMFPDLCTHRPSPGFALWHSPAKTHKTNFNITCSQHIKKCHRSESFLCSSSCSLLTSSFRIGSAIVGSFMFCFLVQKCLGKKKGI